MIDRNRSRWLARLRVQLTLRGIMAGIALVALVLFGILEFPWDQAVQTMRGVGRELNAPAGRLAMAIGLGFAVGNLLLVVLLSHLTRKTVSDTLRHRDQKE